MEVKGNIKKIRDLRDFTRLVLGFFLSLVVLSIYQQVRLIQAGVLDAFFSKSILLLILNHLGFTALLALILVFAFRYFEIKKPGLGYRITVIAFCLFLLAEALLVEYYVRNYELLGTNIWGVIAKANMNLGTIGYGFLLMLFALGIFRLSYKISSSFYDLMGKMYPFTIVLLALFLSTLMADKKPIIENKAQHLVQSSINSLFEANEYKGKKEYPLAQQQWQHDNLASFFKLKEKSPNIVVIVIDGLGAEFTGTNGKYRGFTPFLDGLAQKSLYWENFVSNSLDMQGAITSITGSLPYGTDGFLMTEQPLDRNTMFSILKKDGYRTGFYYGGNTSLNKLDRFLEQEKVDVILDKSSFGDKYQLQDEDQAGNTLGFPDGELYRKWGSMYTAMEQPKLELLVNLSSRKPFAIPDQHAYEEKVLLKIEEAQFDKATKKRFAKNKSALAALMYADASLARFFKMHEITKEHPNTIYLITSNANMLLPNQNGLDRFHVPFMIYSPLLKEAKAIETLASHNDIVPSILGIMQSQYETKLPKYMAWLGDGLLHENKKPIPLWGKSGSSLEMIYHNHLLADGDIYSIGADLKLTESDNDVLEDSIKREYKFFKSVNRYVTEYNKLVPQGTAIYKVSKQPFSKEELVWLNSVFNGNNFDNAFETAKKLAHSGNQKRAILLCDYILDQVPTHTDALILKGRIYAWGKNYTMAQSLLEQAIRKHPTYEDAYAALLDVYYWSDQNELVYQIYQTMQDNNIKSLELIEKVERSIQKTEEFDTQIKTKVTNLYFEEE
ncbi:MAG: sulfatase-like hydrolase/transferase [Croceitalea sp.]|nr:sulfatase-like hydrolase/transferase [Croceitalea sp.]